MKEYKIYVGTFCGYCNSKINMATTKKHECLIFTNGLIDTGENHLKIQSELTNLISKCSRTI